MVSDAKARYSTYIEVIGKVGSDLKVQEYMCNKCGESFGIVFRTTAPRTILTLILWCVDMKSYNQLLTLANGPFKELFV